MTSRKGLFVLNIIIAVVMVLLLIFNVIIISAIVEIKNNPTENTEDNPLGGLGDGIGLVVLLVAQIIVAIPYALCTIGSIVSLTKKYLNWLSIANMVMCVIGIVLTVASFLVA